MTTSPTPSSPAPAGKQATLSLARLWRLTRKELRETLRDRRTIVTLLLMPLLVYPLLSLAFRQFLLTSYHTGAVAEAPMWNVGMQRHEDAQQLEPLLRHGDKVLKRRQATSVHAERNGGAATAADAEAESKLSQTPTGRIAWWQADDPAAALRNREVDVAIQMIRGETANKDEQQPLLRCEVLYRPESAASVDAARFIEQRLQAVNEEQWLARLKALDGQTGAVVAFALRVEQAEQKYSLPLATLVPLILILMTITGAVYPAIDLTAGERERGTLESLIAAPIHRFALLVAKYIAVLTVAVMTALVNITAMTVTVHSTGLGSILFGSRGLSPLSVLAVFGLMVLFAAFFSALLLALTSVARSFKEAQAYLIPLMLIALKPGFLAAVPDVKLVGWWAVTPLANMVLLARDVLEQGPDPWWAIVALASTFVYGLTALVVAAQIFGNDAILYGSADSWDEWLSRPRQVSQTPSMGLAALALALIFPLYVWLSGQLAQTAEWPLATRMLAAAVTTSLLFLVTPLVVCWWRKVHVAAAFQFGGCHPLTLLGAVVLGCSLWPLAHELVIFSQWLGLATLDEEKRAKALELVKTWKQIPLSYTLLCVAIVPAVCEELFFRGFFFSALRTQSKAWTAILLSGTMFGLFHVVLGSGAAVERLFSSTMIGCVLAWVVFRSRSIWPCIALHAVNNGLLITAAYYPNLLWSGETVVSSANLHLPVAWQAGGWLGVAIGAALVWWGTRRIADCRF